MRKEDNYEQEIADRIEKNTATEGRIVLCCCRFFEITNKKN